MATYLFAWNPRLWSWPELPADLARLSRRGRIAIEWSSGRAKNIEPGSRAFLIRLGVPPKGIFGSGVVVSAPVEGPHWLPERAARGMRTNHLGLEIDRLFPLPLVGFDVLGVPPFSRFRWTVRQSGTRIPSTLADLLEARWEAAQDALPAPAPPRGTRRSRSR